jgi:ABC-type antimicrobial peptide transport system permease subunit
MSDWVNQSGDCQIDSRDPQNPSITQQSVNRSFNQPVNATFQWPPPVYLLQSLRTLRSRSYGRLLLGAFASLALVLAAIGIYSVLAYTVRQRVREIGIRMALGAPTTGVFRLVAFEGLKPTLAGVAIGLALAAALSRVMSTMLYGVGTHDASTFVAVGALVLLVGLIASVLPVYHATRIDPDVTLRCE